MSIPYQQAFRLGQHKSINVELITSLEFEADKNVSTNTEIKFREMTFNEVPSRNKIWKKKSKQIIAKLSEIP